MARHSFRRDQQRSIANLIVNAVDPRRILLMTFSRRAASEMTRRVESICADIAALKAEPVRLFLRNSDEIDIQAMDGMTERMLSEDSHFVLDNGATSFAPLSRYLADAVADRGKKMVVHTIIAGGQELVQTGRGFNSVASHSRRVLT